MRVIPFFELDGRRYEIRPTRYLYCQYDELRQTAQISNEDKVNAAILGKMTSDVQRLGKRVSELEEQYFKTFDENDERIYQKALEKFGEKYEELARFEIETGITTNQTKATIDLLEKVAIMGLQESNELTSLQAKEVWEQFVENVGKNVARDWLFDFNECLFNREAEEGEVPFLDQMRARENKKKTRK